MEAGRERKLADFFVLKMNILGDEKECARLSPPQREEWRTPWDFYFKLLIYFDIRLVIKDAEQGTRSRSSDVEVATRWRRGEDGVRPAPPSRVGCSLESVRTVSHSQKVQCS